MIFYDITMNIYPAMAVYKDKEEKKPAFTTEQKSTIETTIKMNLHTGTHIDFPAHIDNKAKNSYQFPLNKLLTTVKVIDLTHITSSIKKEDLTSFSIKANDFILFKTQNSFSNEFNPLFVYLEKSGAEYLADLNIKGVGIDSLGIEREQKGHITHKILFDKDIIILEGLNLSKVPQGIYKMIAMPLKIDNVEALPVSAILVCEKDIVSCF